MQVHFGLPAVRTGPMALSMGSFDGVHIGHQVVVRRLVEAAAQRGLGTAVLSFDPHPRCVLDPANCPPQITTLEERAEALGGIGVQEVIVLSFDRRVAGLSPSEFMAELRERVDLRLLVAGPDFAFGRQRAGTLGWLAEHGQAEGYELVVVDPYDVEGEEVHSSDLRRLITLGEVEQAARLLGREFSMRGLVEPGDHIGRRLGYPTVNLAIAPGKLVPGRGIYAGWALSPLGTHMAAISVGYRPTFDRTELRVEAFLLDFDADLYQQRIELRFSARLRDEERYPDETALAVQIARDVAATRRLLEGRGP